MTCPECGNKEHGCLKEGVRHLMFFNLKELGSICNFIMYQCMKCKTVFFEPEECDEDDFIFVSTKQSEGVET